MIPPVFLLNQASEVSALGVAKRGRAGWTDGELVGPTTWRFLHRPGKDGAATRVDAICMHRPDPKGPGLDREQLYQELSHLTHGITLLGPYTLDQDSLYVNGEGLPSFLFILFLLGFVTVQSLVAVRGLLSCCGAWASWGGISCCRAQSPGHAGFSSCDCWARERAQTQ